MAAPPSDPEPPRRPRAGLALAALALLAALVALLSDTLLGDRVLSQADALLEFPPWSEAAPEGFRPGNPLLLDQAIVMLPWLDFAAERIREGELPLWNPNNYCGQPLVAANTGGTYWPPHLVYYLVPSWRFHAWAGLAKLFAAGLFTLLFLRRLGVGAAASAVGAAAFALGGFSVAWLNHPHTNASLFLPFLLWTIERAAARPGRREIALAALGVGVQLLGGHAQTTLHVLGAAALYAAFRAAFACGGARLGVRGLGALVAGGVLGGLLAAPQVLPFVEYLGESQASALFDQTDTAAPVDAGEAAVFLVAPDHYGSPVDGDYEGPLGPNLNYNELVGGFVGRLALLLALAQLVLGRRDPRTWFFAVFVAIGLLVAWQVEPFYGMARSLPVVRSTKLTRLLLYAGFGLAVLAAKGADSIVAALRWGPLPALAARSAAFAVVALELLAWGRGYNPAIDEALIAPQTPVVAALQEQLAAQAPEPFRVLGAENAILLPNANLFHRIPMISGYDSIEARRTTELVGQMSNDPEAELFIKEIVRFDRPEALPLASLLGVRFVLSGGELPPPLELVRDGELRVYQNPYAMPRAFVANRVERLSDAEAILARMGAADFDPRTAFVECAPGEEGAVDRPAADGESVRTVVYEPRRVEVEAELEQPGLLVFADAWDPGWRAEVNGEDVEVLRVDHTLRAIELPAGTSRVVMRYAPTSTTVGFALGIPALLGVLVLAIGRPRRRTSAS